MDVTPLIIDRKEPLMMDTAKLLMEFSALAGTPGMEDAACGYAAKWLADYGKVGTTPLGGVVCTVREPRAGEPHILLDAHIDEIGMVVTMIDEDGFLKVAASGGVDRRVLMASPVIIHTQSGEVNGVVCSVPPHLQGSEEKKNLSVEEISIDTGMDKETCEQKIRPGDRVTLLSFTRNLLGDRVSGKALDNRAGCVSLMYALETLGGEIPCGLTVQFSSMEEVGGMGAKTGGYRVNPTHAIVVDVSFAHTPDAEKVRCGIMGEGPMIGYAPILTHSLSRRLEELAKENEIPSQPEIMSGRTGTNADAIVTLREGVRTALISVPLKYMHTPIEVVSVSDVEYTGRLVAALVQDIAKGGVR
jgi:endoglucanase